MKENMEIMIKSFLNSKTIPIAGISPIGQLPGVPNDFSPPTLLKEAKSIICYGVPIPKGIIYAGRNELELFWRYCNMAYRNLDVASNQLCVVLEEKGHAATPVYGCYPWKIENREFWGLLPLVYWAEQAGLGKLTKCGLLANPHYGTRILLGAVLTTLELEPTEKLDKELCPSDCVDCVEVCPVKAIKATGKVDHNACLRYSSASPLMAHLLKDAEITEQFSFETIVNTVATDDHGSYLCIQCIKACPLNFA